MLVSVLMSVYKEEETFLREAIESILNQTYSDFEFIIVGDTPPQDRGRVFPIVEEYAQKDSRIKFYPNDNNIGLTKSLNVGLSHCCGKYIARMDADDISLPTRLEKQVAFMEANPHILASSGWIEYIDENGNEIGKIWKLKTDSQQIRLDMFLHSCLAHPASIFHRKVNGIHARYNEELKYAQDYSLWVDMLKYGELSNIPEVLLLYRITPGQISSSRLPEQQECAKNAQKKMLMLYNLPIIESFMDMFFQLTLKNNREIPFETAQKEFQYFLGESKMTLQNKDILNHLVLFYISVFHKYCRPLLSIYTVTKKNPILMIVTELKYIKKGVILKCRVLKNR